MTPFTQNPDDIPKFREGVKKFIGHCLEPWGVSRISFSKDIKTGRWDYECDALLCKFDPDDVDVSLDWFCGLLDRYNVTDYCLIEVGTAWQSASIRDGYGGGL